MYLKGTVLALWLTNSAVGVEALEKPEVARGSLVRCGTSGGRIVEGGAVPTLIECSRRSTGRRTRRVYLGYSTVHHLRAPLYAQRKPSISPRWPIVSQCLQSLEKYLIKTIFRATGAISALLAAHSNSSHASWMYDSCGDGQQHAGPYPSPFHLSTTTRQWGEKGPVSNSPHAPKLLSLVSAAEKHLLA